MKTKMMITAMVATLMLAAFPVPALAGKPAGGGTTGPKVAVTCTYDGMNELITDALTSVAKGTHTEQTKVYSPDGGLYQTFTQGFTLSRAGSYTVTHALPIAGTWAESMPGTWTVKVYLDGVQLGTANFQVI
jgi:hypothetical protein